MAIRVTLLLICLSSVVAFRMQEKHSSITQAKTYKVQLLVIRHGLSCTNVAQKWIHKFDFGRTFMHDVLLAGAGEAASIETGKEVKEWLDTNGFGIDAVLSSVLARSMQTAYYMFPTEPIRVMPYIRELVTPMGPSNSPKPQSEQPAHLQSGLGGKHVPLNYTWVNEFGSEVGTWDEFLVFLEQFFLPELISKGAGQTITLPVVTHSNFMKDNLDKCSKAWTGKGESKPMNNQVVNMVYTFETGAAKNSKEQIPAFFVHGSDYNDGRLNGAWIKLEKLHSGRPQYEKQTDSKCKIEWSEKRKVWRMYIDNLVGAKRLTLFVSEVDSPTLPMYGWVDRSADLDESPKQVKTAVSGEYGTIPRFVSYDAQYKLKEATEVPCDEVASGLSLKNDNGKRDPARLCDRDVGAQCAAAIRAHSWCAGCLDIAEEVLKKEYSYYERAKTSYSQNEQEFQSALKALQEKSGPLAASSPLTVFGSSTEVQEAEQIEEGRKLAEMLQSHAYEMGKQQKVMKDKHEIISEVAAQQCLMGGHPAPPTSSSLGVLEVD